MDDLKIKSVGGAIEMCWERQGITALISSIFRDREHTPKGTLHITIAGNPPVELFHGRANFLSAREQTGLVKMLSERYEADWVRIVGDLYYNADLTIGKGDPVVTLGQKSERPEPPRYLAYPVLAEGKPNVLYGLGGAGKSAFATALAIVVCTGYHENPLGINPKVESANALYLDYETDSEELDWRRACLMRGMDMEDAAFDLVNAQFHYRRCGLPLADDMQAINQLMLANNYGLIIVDSIAAAAGGELNSADTAIRLFTSLRQLKTTTLLIGHMAKNAQGQSSTYGSAFFTNCARSVWELKKVQEVGEDTIRIGLFHRKANSSRLHRPLGFEFNFADDAISIKRQIVGKDIPEMVEDLSAGQRILYYLGEHGKTQYADLLDGTGIAAGSLGPTLKRLADRGKIMHFRDGWALLTKS